MQSVLSSLVMMICSFIIDLSKYPENHINFTILNCFLNIHRIDEKRFDEELKAEQGLAIEFNDTDEKNGFVKQLKDLIQNTQKDMYSAKKLRHKIKLELNHGLEQAILSFQQDAEFRCDDLLQLTFQESRPEAVKDSISHKLNACKQQTMLVKERIKDLCSLVENNNPTLMKEIKKGSLSGLNTSVG